MADQFDVFPPTAWATTPLRPLRVIVTGSRDWTARDVLYDVLNTEIEGSAVVAVGDCPTGVDAMTAAWCRTQPDVTIEVFRADWDALGKSAGPARNQRMVNAGADICLGFPLANSRGTQDTLRKARRAGIQTLVFGPSGRLLADSEEDQ